MDPCRGTHSVDPFRGTHTVDLFRGTHSVDLFRGTHTVDPCRGTLVWIPRRVKSPVTHYFNIVCILHPSHSLHVISLYFLFI